jgi:hypothetical protein
VLSTSARIFLPAAWTTLEIVHENTIAAKRHTALSFISLILGGFGSAKLLRQEYPFFSINRLSTISYPRQKKIYRPKECAAPADMHCKDTVAQLVTVIAMIWISWRGRGGCTISN